MAKQDIIDLKKQYLKDLVSYESKLFFFFLAGSVALVVYFYKNPIISWVKLSVVLFILLWLYERFMFLDLQERYDKMAEEFASNQFSKFKFLSNNNNFILYIFNKSSPVQRIELLFYLVVAIVFIALLLKPLVYGLLN